MLAQYVLFIFLFSFNAKALTFEVIDQEGKMLFQEEVSPSLPSNVGEISMAIFEEFEVPYDGSVYGFSEIFDIGQTTEVLSKTELKAYGWCFSVDGMAPETLTHETPVDEPQAVIQWYYAYAHYQAGEWVGQCVKPLGVSEN